MALSSINFQKVSNHSFKHNDRTEEKTAKTVFQEFSHKNSFNSYAELSNQKFNELYKDSISKITGKERRADKKNTLVEAVVNIKSNTTMKDLRQLQKHIEKEFGFTGLQISIHRDEGHYDDNGKFITNEHAHLSFFTLNKENGRQMFRREHINRDKLRDLQTETANILNMDRGKSKEETGRERLSHKDYKQAKKIEAEKVKDLLATKDQLKEANNQLRSFMKDNGAVRTDYAELEKEKKILEEKLKAKELTEKELLEKFQKLEENFKTTLAQKEKFLGNLQEIGKEIAKEVPIKEIKEIPNAVRTVLNQNKSLQALKSDLEYKVTDLQEKINSRANMSHPQPPKDVQEEFKKIKNEELEEKEIKTGLFSSEKIKVLRPDSNIFQRTWNIVASKYEDLKTKYNDLVFKYNQVANENKTLKAELEELKERSSTKQQKKTITTPEMLVKQMEARTGIESVSSILNEKEVEKEEKTAKKKRSFLSR